MRDPSNKTQFTMQLQAEQEKTLAAEAAQSFLQSILDTGREPFLVLDTTLNVVTANRAFYQTFATDEASTLGRFVYDLGDGQWNLPLLRRLLEEVLPSEAAFEGFEVTHDFPGVGTKTIRLNGRKLYRPGNHTQMFLLALEDITGEREAERARREVEERFTLLVEGARDYGMILLDIEGRIQSWNIGAERILGYPEQEVLGRSASLIFTPEDREQGVPEHEMAQAAAEGQALDVRWHLRKDGTRFWADGVMEALHDDEGRLRGFAKILRDATERKQAEAALEAERLWLTATLEQMPSGVVIVEAPSGKVVFHNEEAKRLLGHPQGRSEKLSEWVGFGAIHADGTFYTPAEYPVIRAAAGAVIAGEELTYRGGDGQTATLSVSAGPLRDASGQIFGAVVSFHDIAAQKQAEAQQRLRAEREELMSRIGAVIRASEDPEEIQQAAVRALGEALGADRCYFAQFLPTQGFSEITTEYHRPDLPPIARRYALAEVPSLADDLYEGGQAYVVSDILAAGFDAETCELLNRLNLRSLLRLPMREGVGVAAALVAAMADGPREWTPEEIALVEAVATLMRTAVADARVRQREHRIATQLQDALQPPLPASAPGLALGKYYEAALDEAGVGGDFFDVFPISDTCTALVVGDLSGKGLAAAAQVSTVRNMLRATLYLGQTVAEAITNLNNLLADNGLLSGFATLFVGVYDASSGALRYVNCGQEPGLVRRASTGEVHRLDPTGPVLGAFPDAAFTQDQTLLCPGDALALFTDGLTEAGPSRANMLELDGVAALLATDMAPMEDAVYAEALTLSLIDSVDRFAGSGVRDDVCLLVAVATG